MTAGDIGLGVSLYMQDTPLSLINGYIDWHDRHKDDDKRTGESALNSAEEAAKAAMFEEIYGKKGKK